MGLIGKIGASISRKRLLKKLAKCGDNVTIGKNCRLLGAIECGNNVFVNEGAYFVSTRAKLIIGDNCVFGPNVTVYTGDHATRVIGKHIIDVTDEDKEKLGGNFDQDVIIEEGCWIGTRAIILKGVTIGKGSVVGAGAIVTKDIPPYSIYVGAPPPQNIPKIHRRANFGTQKEITREHIWGIEKMKMILRKFRDKRKKKLFCQQVTVNPLDFTLFPGGECQNTGGKEKVSIGRHCTVGALLQAFYGGEIHIGNNTYIGPGSIIQSKERVCIGDGVIIANNVLIVDNNNHPVDPTMRLQMSACNDYLHDELWGWKYADSSPIVIEDNVWIGRDSRIMKGVTIGKGSIVALGAIVTKDVPPYTIVAGNPAKVVKQLSVGDEP